MPGMSVDQESQVMGALHALVDQADHRGVDQVDQADQGVPRPAVA